jgi:hypothetical protein
MAFGIGGKRRVISIRTFLNDVNWNTGWIAGDLTGYSYQTRIVTKSDSDAVVTVSIISERQGQFDPAFPILSRVP